MEVEFAEDSNWSFEFSQGGVSIRSECCGVNLTDQEAVIMIEFCEAQLLGNEPYETEGYEP